MRALITVFAAVLLAGCDKSLDATGSEKPSRVRALMWGSGIRAYAWTDQDTGCQYVTTALYENGVSTMPRLDRVGRPMCPEATPVAPARR